MERLLRASGDGSMINTVAEYPIGSIWSVLGIEDGRVVILAGPFAVSRGSPEYLVAPLYSGSESGFVWTSEDVALTTEDTGLGISLYAALWNARPILEGDLVFRLGQLQDEATIAVRDAYWASLNERPLGKSARLGRRIRSSSDPAAIFQADELRRWQELSGRALRCDPGISASAKFMLGDRWSLTVHDVAKLAENIESSEEFLIPLELGAVGPSRASFKATLLSSYVARIVTDRSNLFSTSVPATTQYPVSKGVFVGLKVQLNDERSRDLESVAANSELALAA